MGTILRGRDLVALGITRHHRDARLTAGTLHRVEPDVYCTEPPTGHLLLAALAEKRPHLVFSGPTARQLHDAAPITTPAHGLVARPGDYRSTALLTVRQVRNLHHRSLDGLRVVSPLAAAAGLADTHPAETSDFLERHYAGRHGRAALDADLADLGRVTSTLRDALAAASLFADSETERTVPPAEETGRGRGAELPARPLPLGRSHPPGSGCSSRSTATSITGPVAANRRFTRDRWEGERRCPTRLGRPALHRRMHLLAPGRGGPADHRHSALATGPRRPPHGAGAAGLRGGSAVVVAPGMAPRPGMARLGR
ncbi:hypothetical protein QP028_06790 [Corynebacterium suedekumii]|nr:hypothetical protein QP028_06790 [Corynebacterium suedekumii]